MWYGWAAGMNDLTVFVDTMTDASSAARAVLPDPDPILMIKEQ